MSGLERLRNTEVSPKTAFISIGALLIVALVVVLFVKNAASKAPETVKPQVPVKVEVSESKKKVDKKTDEKADTKVEKEVDPCAAIAERNIFRSLAVTVVKKPVAAAVAPATPVAPMPMPMHMPPPSGMMGGAPKNIAFTGIVDTPGGQLALLENTATSECAYVGIGQSAFGARVVGITQSSVMLDMNGSVVNLMLGENKSDKGASSPAPAAPGPSGPPGGPEGNRPPGGGMPPHP